MFILTVQRTCWDGVGLVEVQMGAQVEQNTVARQEILIIEDCPIQAEQLQLMLERRGFTVYIASGGAEALSMVEAHLPELIISDVVMPLMDGFELCRRIRADERTRNIPVILLSVLSDSSEVIKGLMCGADNFISKPFDEERLLAQIKHIFDNVGLLGRNLSDGGVEVIIRGQRHCIKSDPLRIISFLLYSYETAIEKNEELSSLSDELRYMGTHDFLTGLYNRTFFEEELKRLTLSRQFPVSVLVADVDGLKAVNDSLGHDAGDRLLRLVAEVLATSFRSGDVVARIGGDEFGVLLPDADGSVVAGSIERIRGKLKSIDVGAVGFVVNVSLGSATAFSADDMSSAMKLSDERMYLEKIVRKRNNFGGLVNYHIADS